MPDDNGITVTWQSQLGVSYCLERGTTPCSALFTPLATGMPGQPETTSFTDTNVTSATARFYRVGVGN